MEPMKVQVGGTSLKVEDSGKTSQRRQQLRWGLKEKQELGQERKAGISSGGRAYAKVQGPKKAWCRSLGKLTDHLLFLVYLNGVGFLMASLCALTAPSLERQGGWMGQWLTRWLWDESPASSLYQRQTITVWLSGLSCIRLAELPGSLPHQGQPKWSPPRWLMLPSSTSPGSVAKCCCHLFILLLSHYWKSISCPSQMKFSGWDGVHKSNGNKIILKKGNRNQKSALGYSGNTEE
jgi:hypothetical protein